MGNRTKRRLESLRRGSSPGDIDEIRARQEPYDLLTLRQVHITNELLAKLLDVIDLNLGLTTVDQGVLRAFSALIVKDKDRCLYCLRWCRQRERLERGSSLIKARKIRQEDVARSRCKRTFLLGVGPGEGIRVGARVDAISMMRRCKKIGFEM